jgi:hypothetical protein
MHFEDNIMAWQKDHVSAEQLKKPPRYTPHVHHRL